MTCAPFGANLIVCCVPLLTSLQPCWCFLSTPNTLSFHSPPLALPSWNRLPRICLLMAHLYSSRQLSWHFPGRSFLTSQPQVAFISYSVTLIVVPLSELTLPIYSLIWKDVSSCPRPLPSHISCLRTGTLAVLFTSASPTHGAQYLIVSFWINYVKRKLVDVGTWPILTTTAHSGKPRCAGSIHLSVWPTG